MKKGFTMAEVLITLVVVGVVVVLTLPNMIQKHQNRVFVTQLRRTMNLISNAATQFLSDENAISLADTSLVAIITGYHGGKVVYDNDIAQGHFLNKYFKVARDCGRTDDNKPCLGEKYYSLDKTKEFDLNNYMQKPGTKRGFHCVLLNTGVTICMTPMRHDYPEIPRLEHGWSSIIVDVNGPSGPNTNGRDLHQFNLYSDRKIGTSYQADEYRTSGKRCQDKKGTAGYSGSCFQHIVSNKWVMDY